MLFDQGSRKDTYLIAKSCSLSSTPPLENTRSIPDNLLTPEKIGEELTKEIMDSSFISARTKQEYCKQLAPLTDLTSTLVGETENGSGPRPTPRSDLAEYRRRMIGLVSAMMGFTVAMMTLYLTVSGNSTAATIESIELLLPTGIALLTTLMATALMVMRRRLPHRGMEDRGRRQHEEQDSDINPNMKPT